MIKDSFRTDGDSALRFVRKHHTAKGLYIWCEQSLEDSRLDVAQGTCEAEDLPDDVRELCDKYDGQFYACVWPYDLD